MINKSKIVKDAQKFVAKGQLDKAIAEYGKIVSASPNDTNTHNTIGDLYLKVGDKEKAIESFRAAADILNKDGFALKAIALYKKVLNINPGQIDVLMHMGKLNAERGMLGNANENYLAVASHYTKQGKRDKALDVYKILCNLNPKNTTLAQKLAELYMSEGMEAEGLGKLIELADIKLQGGDINEAKQYLDRARNKGSDRHDFMRINALINLKEGRIPEAVSELETLRSVDPGNYKVLNLLCDAYMHSGRYEEAASVVDDLLDKDANNVDYRKKLIDIHIKSGDFEQAWEQYRYVAEIHIDKKEHNKAQKLIQEYLEHDADSIDARQMLADLYTSIGRTDKISELHAQMADIYNRNGDTEKALNIYNKLIEQEPDNEDFKTAVKNLGQIEKPADEKETIAEPPPPEDVFAGFKETGTDETSAGLELEGPAEETSAGPEPEGPAWDIEPGESQDSGLAGGLPEDISLEGPQFDLEQTGEAEADAGDGTGEPTYDLSDIPDDLPPLDFGEETGEDIFTEPESPAGVYEIDEETVGDIGDLEMFAAESGSETEGQADDISEPRSDIPSYDMSDLEAAAGMDSMAETEDQVFQEGSSLDESITEADVYIKYGLYPKALEVLTALEHTNPANPDIQLRLIDICKAQNDMDGFVERSLQLAGIYKSKEMDDKAAAVLEKAIELNPGDDRLRLYAESSASGTQEQPDIADTGYDAIYGEQPASGTTEITGLQTEENEEIGVSPGSVSFMEELAEADFYANQGLYDEARSIYRRLLAADPENDELRSKYNELTDMDQENLPEEEELVPDETAQESSEEIETAATETFEPAGDNFTEAPSQPAGGLDDELDEAFRETYFGEEETSDEQPPDISGAQEEEAEPSLPQQPVHETMEESEPSGGDDEDFFDLAAELREEMGADIIAPSVPGSSLGDNNLDEVFQEFRKGVNDQLGSEDYETHYNLGIAYKEMGMIDEALTEFTEASKDVSRTLDCASMLGLCHLEKGEYGKAIEHFKRGLEVKGREKEEYFGLKYDMATAYELAGDPVSALSAITDIYKEDQEFRDVKKRYQRLDKSAGTADDGDDGASGSNTKTRKSRVSYL